jgi:hypothetical protein
MQSTAQRFNVPAGFSGWWCARCETGIATIPEEAGSPARCPRCHKWTVWWIPPMQNEELKMQNGNGRERAGEQRALSAGVEWVRKMPRAEDAKRLFDHMHQVIENPDLEPDLRKLDDEAAKR